MRLIKLNNNFKNKKMKNFLLLIILSALFAACTKSDSVSISEQKGRKQKSVELSVALETYFPVGEDAIISIDSAKWVVENVGTGNNIYWSVGNGPMISQPRVIYENSPLVLDPLIVLPDSTDFKPVIGKLELLPYFRLKVNSPCIGKGNLIRTVGLDFWGNRVSDNIGADASQPRK